MYVWYSYVAARMARTGRFFSGFALHRLGIAHVTRRARHGTDRNPRALHNEAAARVRKTSHIRAEAGGTSKSETARRSAISQRIALETKQRHQAAIEAREENQAARAAAVSGNPTRCVDVAAGCSASNSFPGVPHQETKTALSRLRWFVCAEHGRIRSSAHLQARCLLYPFKAVAL